MAPPGVLSELMPFLYESNHQFFKLKMSSVCTSWVEEQPATFYNELSILLWYVHTICSPQKSFHKTKIPTHGRNEWPHTGKCVMVSNCPSSHAFVMNFTSVWFLFCLAALSLKSRRYFVLDAPCVFQKTFLQTCRNTPPFRGW